MVFVYDIVTPYNSSVGTMLTAFLVVAFLTLSFDVAVGDVQFRGVNIAG